MTVDWSGILAQKLVNIGELYVIVVMVKNLELTFPHRYPLEKATQEAAAVSSFAGVPFARIRFNADL